MEDRGSHQEPAYRDHRKDSEVAFPLWPPNQGDGPIEKLKNQEVLGT